MTVELQLALDDIDKALALQLVRDVADAIDIVEVGTPLMMRYGLGIIADLKASTNARVLCDAKIMDAARYEAQLCFDAGADLVTILGVTDDASIRDCVAQAHEQSGQVVVDMICVPNLAERAKEVASFGADVIAVHTGVDQQALGRTPLDDLRTITEAVPAATVAVAGGISADSVADYVALKPSIVIVGGAILHADDPVAATRQLRDAIGEATK